MMSLKGVTAPLPGVSALLWGVAALLSGVEAPLRLSLFSPSALVIMCGLGPWDSHRQLEELLALVVVGVVLVLPLVPLDEELTAELLLLLLLPPGATELLTTPTTKKVSNESRSHFHQSRCEDTVRCTEFITSYLLLNSSGPFKTIMIDANIKSSFELVTLL